jgi:hypothetical protein
MDIMTRTHILDFEGEEATLRLADEPLTLYKLKAKLSVP